MYLFVVVWYPFIFIFLTAGCKPNCRLIYRMIKLPWILNTYTQLCCVSNIFRAACHTNSWLAGKIILLASWLSCRVVFMAAGVWFCSEVWHVSNIAQHRFIAFFCKRGSWHWEVHQHCGVYWHPASSRHSCIRFGTARSCFLARNGSHVAVSFSNLQTAKTSEIQPQLYLWFHRWFHLTHAQKLCQEVKYEWLNKEVNKLNITTAHTLLIVACPSSIIRVSCDYCIVIRTARQIKITSEWIELRCEFGQIGNKNDWGLRLIVTWGLPAIETDWKFVCCEMLAAHSWTTVCLLI